jgi:hypothetical protein
MEDPGLSVNAKRDPAFSLDKLRYEQFERYKEDVTRQKRIIDLLDYIRGALYVIAALLVYICWRLW